MFLNKKYKVEKCLSKDMGRYPLTHTHLSGNFLYASDGKRLVRVRVDRHEKDTDGLVDISMTKLLPKDKDKVYSIEVDSEQRSGGYVSKRPDGSFPDVNGIIKQSNDRKVEYKIGLNPKLLYELAQSMGVDSNESVTLTMKGNDKAIEVTTASNPEVFGILMPMKVD